MVYRLEVNTGGGYAIDAAFPFVYQLAGSQAVYGTPFKTGRAATPLVLTNAGMYGAFPGVLFRVSAAAELTKIAALPETSYVALAEGSNGLLYLNEGASIDSTTLTGGNYQTIKSFSGTSVCHEALTGLTLASDGALYGECQGQPLALNAPIFKITPTGKFDFVYAAAQPDIYASLSGLAAQGSDGLLYGTIQNAFFSANPSEYGAVVIIYGGHFLGTSSVTVDGLFVPFTVNSDSFLTITIPQGATTGPVLVTTPNGTGQSKKSFTVTQ